MPVNGMPAITRVAMYIRVSTEEQAEEGWSVDAQERALRSFCQAKDWQVVQVYKDEGRTGTNTNRPGFQAMLRDARNRKFDAIVVHKLDRFSRNLEDVLRILGELEKWSVSFVSATEANLDFTTPYGRMMLGVMGTMSQWYVDNLRNETTKGKRERFEQGLYNGDLRFGYSKGEDGKPVLNTDAKGVRLAYQWCAEGKTDAEIAALMNRARYRTYRLIANCKKKAGPEVDRKLRRPWTKDSVASLLRAGQFYLGNTEYEGEAERKNLAMALKRGEKYVVQSQINHNTHPAIISLSTYENAIAARKKRVKPGRLTTPQSPRTYLLGAGLARCTICGDPLRCTNNQPGRKYQYYRCTALVRGGSCTASQRHVREDLLEPQIDALIGELTLPDDWRERAQQLLAVDDSPNHDAKVQRAKELKEELHRLGFQHQKNLIGDNEYVRQAEPVKAELDQLERLSAARMPEHVVISGEQMITIHSSWAMATKEQKRDMLHLMLSAVYVDTNKHEIVSFEPHPEFALLFAQTSMQRRDGRYILRPLEDGESPIILFTDKSH
jgi:site-specific DNA recombinase